MTNAYTDPVCGMQVDNERISTIHEGIQQVFCSSTCQQKFIANPAAYLQPQAANTGKNPKKDCCG